eukprot:TRINITY_DN3345_c0_g1_i4.p1 TRINITY_DN3345_c0_g1~~TRINITY_DN3345_c0_g1_i4.p1  ORF type:complete len:490 (-),score=94.42 TRINITY_DN3345_c0_g1_i4:44-1513(-)
MIDSEGDGSIDGLQQLVADTTSQHIGQMAALSAMRSLPLPVHSDLVGINPNLMSQLEPPNGKKRKKKEPAINSAGSNYHSSRVRKKKQQQVSPPPSSSASQPVQNVTPISYFHPLLQLSMAPSQHLSSNQHINSGQHLGANQHLSSAPHMSSSQVQHLSSNPSASSPAMMYNNAYNQLMYRHNFLGGHDQDHYQLVQQQLANQEALRMMREAQMTRPLQQEEPHTPLNYSSASMQLPISPTISMDLRPASSTKSHYTGRFILQEQPNARQRKSYKNENRYLLPNPLTICARETAPDERLPMISDGKVTVSLVDVHGSELPNKHAVLECPEGLVSSLDQSLKAKFSLKMTETSEGAMYRLLFVVQFRINGLGQCEEKVMSSPFQVTANIKKNTKGRNSAREIPVVIDMKPKDGPPETEVWIKGQYFSDKVTVIFGDKTAKVLEVSENLVTALAPSQRSDLSPGSAVSVTLANKYSGESLVAERVLTYIYT